MNTISLEKCETKIAAQKFAIIFFQKIKTFPTTSIDLAVNIENLKG